MNKPYSLLHTLLLRIKRNICETNLLVSHWRETREALLPRLVVAHVPVLHEPKIELWLMGEPLNRKSSMDEEAVE